MIRYFVSDIKGERHEIKEILNHHGDHEPCLGSWLHSRTKILLVHNGNDLDS